MRTRRGGTQKRDRGAGALAKFGLLILICLAGWIIAKYEASPIDPTDARRIQIQIPKGARSKAIADILVAKGLARNPEIVTGLLVISGQSGRLKAGGYALSRSMSVRHIIDTIADGATDSTTVVIPEGFTDDQIAERLASKDLADSAEFVSIARSSGDTFDFPDGFSPPKNLEGFLYPLTYAVPRGAPSETIIGQMVSAFDRSVVSRYPNVHDWSRTVTVASLIESEAKVDSDRPIIASVYYNRLKKGMPLQCDATVQYALPEHKTRLYFSDLSVRSPYNTYLHKGLPPGPICNPGLLSIDAAIHPAHTGYLYYVAGPGGAHIFSRTLAEQDRAIKMLRHFD
jgi:UPF0755 protein